MRRTRRLAVLVAVNGVLVAVAGWLGAAALNFVIAAVLVVIAIILFGTARRLDRRPDVAVPEWARRSPRLPSRAWSVLDSMREEQLLGKGSGADDFR